MDLPRTAAGVAGISAIALGVITVTGPTVPDTNWGTRGSVVNALGLITFAALACAAERIIALAQLSRVGRAGVRTSQTGLGLMTIESLASQVHGGNTLGPVFLLGLLLALIGYLVAGVDGMIGPRGRWLALLPLAGFAIAIGAGDRGGFLVLGLIWCVLCLAVPPGLARREPTEEQVGAVR